MRVYVSLHVWADVCMPVCIYASLNSWVPTRQSLILHILLFWCSNCPRFSQWGALQGGSCVLEVCSHYTLSIVSLSSTMRCFRLIFHSPWPRPRTNLGAWVLLVGDGMKIGVLGALLATGGSLLLVSQWTEQEMCIYTHTHTQYTQAYIYICFYGYFCIYQCIYIFPIYFILCFYYPSCYLML